MTRSAKNLLLDMAEVAKIDGNDDSGGNKTGQKITFFQKVTGIYRLETLPTRLQTKFLFVLCKVLGAF